MKRRATLVTILSVVVLLVAGVVSRNHAIHVGETHMTELIRRGWRLSRPRLHAALNGLFWVMTYQPPAHDSCFPFQVVVSATGKTFFAPSQQEIQDMIDVWNIEQTEAEQRPEPYR